MSNVQQTVDIKNVELEAERIIEKKASNVVVTAVIATALAFVCGIVVTKVTRFSADLYFISAVAAPVILCIALRVTYIRTIYRDQVVRKMLSKIDTDSQ